MADSQHGDATFCTKHGKGANVAERIMAQETSSTSNTRAPCGACKFLRRKCTDGCFFAPYFDIDDGAAKFAIVHKVFGAGNAAKLLSKVPTSHRYEAASTLFYEAQLRLSDPVNGCISTITALHQQMATLQAEVNIMRTQLIDRRFANFSAPMQPTNSNNSSIVTNNLVNMDYFNPGFNFTMETPPSSHNIESLQLSQFSRYGKRD